MNDYEEKAPMGCLVAAMVVGVLGMFVVGGIADSIAERWENDVKVYRTEAVNHGAAEWRVQPDGTTTFHWINRKDEPK